MSNDKSDEGISRPLDRIGGDVPVRQPREPKPGAAQGLVLDLAEGVWPRVRTLEEAEGEDDE